MKRYLIIAITAVLISCGTTARYEKMLDSWVGAHEIDLIRYWGKPLSSEKIADVKIITYRKPHYTPFPKPELVRTDGIGRRIGPKKMYADNNNYCTTTFMIKNSKVVSWEHFGNNCKK